MSHNAHYLEVLPFLRITVLFFPSSTKWVADECRQLSRKGNIRSSITYSREAREWASASARSCQCLNWQTVASRQVNVHRALFQCIICKVSKYLPLSNRFIDLFIIGQVIQEKLGAQAEAGQNAGLGSPEQATKTWSPLEDGRGKHSNR